MRELNENEVILDRAEYECLLGEARKYDPAPWCKPGICEGVSKHCKYTCPDSDYMQEIAEGIRAFINNQVACTPLKQDILNAVKPFMQKYYGCELFEQETANDAVLSSEECQSSIMLAKENERLQLKIDCLRDSVLWYSEYIKKANSEMAAKFKSFIFSEENVKSKDFIEQGIIILFEDNINKFLSQFDNGTKE